MTDWTRRDVLRASALAAAGVLAGCTGRDGDPETATSSETTARTTTDSPVKVAGFTPRESVVYPLLDTLDVAGADRQFLFATVEPNGASVAAEEFRFAAGDTDATGTRYVGAMSPSGPWQRVEGLGDAVDGRESGWVAFELPPRLTAEQAAVTYAPSGKSWPVPDSAMTALTAAAPSFEQKTLAVETAGDGSFTARVRVRNTGDRPATFRGCVNVAYADQRAFALDVPAGDTRAWSWSETAREDQEVTVKTLLGSASATVE